MRVLGFNGIEHRNKAFDGITTTTGSSTYLTTDLPADTHSTSKLQIQGDHWIPWVSFGSTATSALEEPAGDEWAFGCWTRPPANDTSNDLFISGVGRNSGAVIVGVSRQDTTGYTTLVVDGTVVATSTSVHGINWRRYTVRVNEDAGWVKVYVDGELLTPIINHTLGGSLSAKPNGFRVLSNTSLNWIDDFCAIEIEIGDPANTFLRMKNAKIIGRVVPIGAGPDTTWTDGAAGTGLFSAIDEIPYSDADYIQAVAVNAVSTFEFGDINEDEILAIQARLRVTSVGTDAGTKLQVRVTTDGNSLDFPSAAAPVPGDGWMVIRLETDGNGDEWAPVGFNGGASVVGPVSRT